MSNAIAAYIGSLSGAFFIRQVMVITMLFVLGYLITKAAYSGRSGIYEVLLSFPVGISFYSMAVFLMIVTGIPFGTVSITLICFTAAIYSTVVLVRQSYFGKIGGKRLITGIITVLCIAVISTSGLLPVSLSNDSLYYYHMYPHALVHNGGFRMQFNVFLTDVGQTSAMLNTLPFVYGFDEGFGIQAFLNINTLFIMIYALYGECIKRYEKKKAITATSIAAAALIVSMPYLVMSGWAMSNGYFMCFMFICVYTAWREADDKETADDKRSVSRMSVMGLMFVMMSLLRMEGCIAALILVLCFSTVKYKGRQLFVTSLLPVFTVSAIYDIRIFLLMKIDAPYTFLTPAKALIQLAAIAAVSVYVLFIRDRLPDKISRHTGMIIIAGLVLVNAVLFAYDRTLYIGNVKAFIHNISNQSGWGLFPMFIIGIYLMCIIAQYRKTGYNTTYWDICFAAYLLTAIAVSFARDDVLQESIADSGNRVMLQATLLAFFAAAQHVISIQDNNTD